ncbi:MAG TPA: hypothetical protein VK530_06520, partial [Candidatus Acidoferrum sp.]|nr:hypothetical protein [Candidatus Acidoferrum sp.]
MKPPLCRFTLLAFALLIVIAGCARFRGPKPSPDEVFSAIANEYMSGHLAWRPASGMALGLHEYDGRISDFSRASLDAELKRLKDFELKLRAIDVMKLSHANTFDLRVLRSAIEQEIFSFEQERAFERNPMTYAEAIDLTQYVKRDFAPLESRVRS